MTTGRNDPCPCGSGKKFKKCCLEKKPQGHQKAPPKPMPTPTPTPTPQAQLEKARAALASRNFGLARDYIKPLLEKTPVDATVWSLASGIEMQNKNFCLAQSYIEKALERQPENAIYLYNYATILAQTDNRAKAVDTFRRALEIKPDMYQAMNNLGNTLRDLGNTREAIQCYQKVFQNAIYDPRTLSQILVSMHFFCFDEHEELYEMHCDLGRKIAARIPPNSPTRRPGQAEAREKIRLGYLSPRLSREIVSYFFKPIFDNHDRSRFEIYLYSATPRLDDMTEYFSQRADKWTDVRHLSDTALCQAIVDDKIDILIDLAGHAPENRITATARKPAPVQLSMLDYFDTTGIDAVDYYVTDNFSTPPDGKQKFSEQLITLKQPRLVYEPPAYAPLVRTRDIADGEIVFGSFNRHQKVIPRVVAVWSELLRAVGGSRLVLKGSAFAKTEIQVNYLKRFREHGVGPERIIFRGPSPHSDMLGEYGDVDIALDTFPYNGGLTTLEALWMGTPVIAMEGERIISRQSAGMLHSLGIPEFIAQSAEEFAAIGTYWSQHRQELNCLRESLRERMATSPLTNGPEYTRELESHFEICWRRYLAQAS